MPRITPAISRAGVIRTAMHNSEEFRMIKPVVVYLVSLCGLMPLPQAADAGTLSGGRWSAAGCGQEPAAPAIESSSADAYNRSLKRAREWQQQAQAYNNCVVQEANGDNEVIAKAANAQQARFKAAVNEIQTKATEIKAKLDRQ